MYAVFGCEIIVLDDKEDASDAEELTRDLMALLASFSVKYYGRRNLKKRKQNKNFIMRNIDTLSFNELVSLYNILNDICLDYSRMTDTYSLASGDNLFEHAPQDIQTMIKERQKFFDIRNKIKEKVKKRILTDYDF